MQFTTLALAVLASTATAFPVWNPVIIRGPEVAAPAIAAPAFNPTVPRDVPYPSGTAPVPTGTGYAAKPEVKRWEKPASPPAPQPASRNVPVYPVANPMSGRTPAPWFAMF